jgi:hypothetical protein
MKVILGLEILTGLEKEYLESEEKDMVAVAAKVFGLSDEDLNLLSYYLVGAEELKRFEEHVKIFALHAAMERGRIRAIHKKDAEEGSHYRKITEREAGLRPSQQ